MQNSVVRYAPLFIHSFVLCAPRKILEATQFNQRYRSYEESDNVPDRLRRLRHSKGLMQAEMAQMIRMKRGAYKNLLDYTTSRMRSAVIILLCWGKMRLF